MFSNRQFAKSAKNRQLLGGDVQQKRRAINTQTNLEPSTSLPHPGATPFPSGRLCPAPRPTPAREVEPAPLIGCVPSDWLRPLQLAAVPPNWLPSLLALAFAAAFTSFLFPTPFFGTALSALSRCRGWGHHLPLNCWPWLLRGPGQPCYLRERAIYLELP